MGKKEISIVVPAYNEAENLRKLVKVVSETGRNNNWNFEILVVDDHSTDATKEILGGLKGKFPELRVIERSDGRRGMGYSLIEGTEKASGDIILWAMADLSDNPATFRKLVEKVRGGYDVVVGSRWMKGGSRGNLGFFKALASRACSTVFRIAFGIPIHDTTNAFRAFRKKSFAKLRIESGDFAISPEFAIKAKLTGLKIGKVPTDYSDRKAGRSNFRMLQMVARYFSLLKYRFSK